MRYQPAVYRVVSRVIAAATLLALVPPFLTSARAQTPTSFVVAEFNPPVTNQFSLYGFRNDGFQPAQTFTATRDGKLQTIRVLLAENGSVPNAVVVEVRPVDGLSGLPTAEILASAAANTSSLSATPAYFTADFSSAALVLRAGTHYAFSLRTVGNVSGVSAVAVGDLQAGVNPYEGGAHTRTSDRGLTWNIVGPGYYDLGFRVTAVPAVITSPDNTFGTGRLSLDLVTGLEWLDLPLTQGRSPADILAGYGNYITAGFRFASAAEVQALWEDFGLSHFGSATAASQDVAAAQAIVDTLGATFSSSGAATTAGHAVHPLGGGLYTQSSVEVFTTSSWCTDFGLSTPCARALPVNGAVQPTQVTNYVGAKLVRDRGRIDQFFYPSNFGGGDISINGYQLGGLPSQSLAQTFTVGTSGRLTRVAVQLGGFGAPTVQVQLEIRPTIAGVPSSVGSALASATIPVASILSANPTNAFITVDLSAPIQVTTGTVLAIVLSSGEQIGTYTWKAANSYSNPPPPLYFAGAGFFRDTNDPTWRTSGTTDHGFQTYMDLDIDPDMTADETAPAIAVPVTVTAEATNAGGAAVTYTVSVLDDVDPAPSLTCNPVSGSVFPLGTTPVNCIATDAAGNSGTAAFSVRVVDTVGPVISNLSSAITIEAGGATGTVATWTSPIASDVVSGSAAVTCTPASGGIFPLGVTTVSCTANDAAGNTSSGSFLVRVVDSTRPVISGMPATLIVEATGPAGAAATWPSPVSSDAVSGAVPVTCMPSSGSMFVLGTTTVLCGATDGAGNSASASFSVSVRDTTRPTLALVSPTRDANITSWTDITVTAADLVGVTSVVEAYGTVFTRIAGTSQNGTWRATIPIRSYYYLGRNFNVYSDIRLNASDASANVRNEVLIDNDGIPAAIDHPRLDFSIDQSNIYSSEFNDGSTSGGIVMNGWFVTATKLTGAGVRLTASVGAPWNYWPYVPALCGGTYKEVDLDAVGETIDVSCQGTTLTARAIVAWSGIDVWKHLVGGGCYALSGCYHYDYWTKTTLATGQSVSTGSPVTADPGNPQPLHVAIGRTLGDGSDPSEIPMGARPFEELGSFDLDPGESADVHVVLGASSDEDQVQVQVLHGTVTFTVAQRTVTLGEGDQAVLGTIPPAPQTIAFAALGDKILGDAPFEVSATASSGLPVSFSASGSCSVSGSTISLISWGSCSITASQAGNTSYLPAPELTKTFSVQHSWSNFLQPVNTDGTSIFKLGSTVPVKFKLTGGSAGVTTLGARILVAKASSGIAGTELEPIATNVADAGNVFRYDAGGGQYIFNWGTKGLSEGTWQVRVDLLDGGTGHTVFVSLKK